MSTKIVYQTKKEGAFFCSSETLAEVALEVREDLTQEEVAEQLNVSKQAISKAENESIGSSMNGLRVRIIREIGKLHVEGPFWIVDSEREPSD
jgi:DNA-binding XRE family transcriptional regulator